MKLSMFNVWNDDDPLIIYNAKTGALATFEPPYRAPVLAALTNHNPSLLPQEFVEILTEDGYLVGKETDELAYIQGLVEARQKLTAEYYFSILLSLACNFDCFYCFEDHTGKILDAAVAQRLIAMMERIAPTAKKIAIDWYGGEPLLSFPRLQQLNDRFMALCAANGTHYEISITTNGYLLTQEVIDYLKGVPITHLQITLDGPPDTHDQSRPLKNGGPTFAMILDHIENAVRNGLGIFIRVNITRHNIDRIYELYRILAARGLKNKVRLLLKPVVSSPVRPCEDDCLMGVDLSSRMVPIYVQAAKDGWIVFPHVNSMQCMGFCVADFPSQFIIDPSGAVYKCGECFSEAETVGSLADDGEIVLNQEAYQPWVKKTPLDYPECRACQILPICMGGCNMKRWWHKTDCCEELKHNLPDFLRAMVLNQDNMSQARS